MKKVKKVFVQCITFKSTGVKNIIGVTVTPLPRGRGRLSIEVGDGHTGHTGTLGTRVSSIAPINESIVGEGQLLFNEK